MCLFDPPVQSEHRMVLCKFAAPAVKRTWEQSNDSSNCARHRGKLRRLDFTEHSAEVYLGYQENLLFALINSQPGWLATEKAMKFTAEKTLNQDLHVTRL
jgi:hypothetical protein